jgi:hypothetical protein
MSISTTARTGSIRPPPILRKGKAKYQQWLEQERQKKREAEANQSPQ